MAEALIGSNRFYGVPFPIAIGNRYIHVSRRPDDTPAVQCFRWDPANRSVSEESLSAGEGRGAPLTVMPAEGAGGVRLVLHGEAVEGYVSDGADTAYTVLLQQDRIKVVRGDTPVIELQEASIAGFEVGVHIHDDGTSIGSRLPEGFEYRQVQRGGQVTLSRLVTSQNPILRKYRFEDVEVYGPALLCAIGPAQISDSVFDVDQIESVAWELRPGQKPYGAILVDHVDFLRCQFFGVALAVEPGTVEEFLRGFSGSDR